MLLFQEIHPVAIIILALIASFLIKAVVKFVIQIVVTILRLVVFLFIGYLLILFVGDKKTARNSTVSNPPKVEEAIVVSNGDSTLNRNKPLFVPKTETESSTLKKKGTIFIRLNETYSIRYNANNQKKQIKAYPAIVEKRIIDNITTYFIIVGPFSSKGEATEYLNKVQESRFPFEGKIFSIKPDSFS